MCSIGFFEMKLNNSNDTLYIRIGAKDFVFVRYDHMQPQTLNYVTYKVKPNISLNANMHEAIKKVNLTKDDFGFVRVLVEGAATLIPLNDFDEDDAENFYFFNLPEKRRWRRVFYDTLPHMNAVLLFSIDKDIFHTLEESFHNLFIQSCETSLLLYFAQCCPASLSRGRMFVNLTNEKMNIFAFRKGKLTLYNTFVLHHENDAIYYLLQTIKLWNFIPENDELFLKGNKSCTEELKLTIKQYVSHVEIIDQSKDFNEMMLTLQNVLPFDLVILLLRAF